MDGVSASGYPIGAPTGRKRRELAELLLGYGLIVAVLWTPRPEQRFVFCAAALFLGLTLALSWPGRDALGLRLTNLGRSMWIAIAASLIAAIAVLLAARAHTLSWPRGAVPFLHRYLGYAIWAFFQQVLLQGYFLLRFKDLLSTPQKSAIVCAIIFSAAHVPSPILVMATVLWGLISCLLFLHYRNLYPLALAHAILGITISLTIPAPVIRNMRVGLGYITYGHRLHHLSHSDQTVSTQAWVMADAPTRRLLLHALP